MSFAPLNNRYLFVFINKKEPFVSNMTTKGQRFSIAMWGLLQQITTVDVLIVELR